MVNKTQNYIEDIIDSDLKEVVYKGLLYATIDLTFAKNVDIIYICVPTPLDVCLEPDFFHIKNSTENIAKYLHPGMLVVLESTTYPGTTEELLKPILEKKSGLKCGQNFFWLFLRIGLNPIMPGAR